jgi:divalent metal cation (Fe/Co/Zn/Cd) transporter
MASMLLDAAGHRRSPTTMPGYHRGRPPRNKGERYPCGPRDERCLMRDATPTSSPHMTLEPCGATSEMLLRRGLMLEYATLAWNVVGTVVLVIAAAATASVALAGFGVDSLIEIVASAVVVWQLKGEVGSGRERRALRIIAIAFVLLAVYIVVQSALALSSRSHPGHSVVGITWLAVTVAAMFTLAAGKRDTGRRLGNAVLLTEARVTVIDGALAAAVLLGVVLNAAAGWWWADPLSALVILVYGLREAHHAWTEVP